MEKRYSKAKSGLEGVKAAVYSGVGVSTLIGLLPDSLDPAIVKLIAGSSALIFFAGKNWLKNWAIPEITKKIKWTEEFLNPIKSLL